MNNKRFNKNREQNSFGRKRTSRTDEERYTDEQRSPKRSYGKRTSYAQDKTEYSDKRKSPYDRERSSSKRLEVIKRDDKNFKADRETLQKKHYSKKKQLQYKKDNIHREESIRLNRYIANAGVCSRREADQLIEKGMVSVNGKVVTEVGVKVKIEDKVVIDNKILNPEKKVYILLNKPKDCVTTAKDPMGRRTVMDYIKGACKERVFPVGRLDRMTTGLLLFTNDGDLTKKLTHPKYEKKKIYHAFLNKDISKHELLAIAEGIELEDGFIAADEISYVDNIKNQVGIEIHSGKNRIVRRIFEHMGYDVVKLDRVFFAGLTKKNLPRGHWRHLSDREVTMLKSY